MAVRDEIYRMFADGVVEFHACGGDVYLIMCSSVYGVTVERHEKDEL